eukprot:6210967-Pleurochrysis_carterae.AAC.2
MHPSIEACVCQQRMQLSLLSRPKHLLVRSASFVPSVCKRVASARVDRDSLVHAGFISPKEMIAALTNFGITLTERETTLLIAEATLTSGGQKNVSYEVRMRQQRDTYEVGWRQIECRNSRVQ